jgi:two-component system response regulator MprA
MRVLVVDDEPALRESLARSLRFEGYEVAMAGNGLDALDVVAQRRPHAVVLDIVMPRLNGIEACRRIRERGDRTPIIVLTARDAVGDRVQGLNAGADDYLVKPFALEELLARLRAVLRRSGTAAAQPPITVGDLTLDEASWSVVRDGRDLNLTRTEFELLDVLMRHAGQVLTRAQLYERVWGTDLNGMSNSLDVYVGYLRKKLGEPRMVHTVRGVGFVLRPGGGQ